MFKMDNIGLETYSSAYNAAETFAGNIHLENIKVDTELELNYDLNISFENIFYSEGMEDIKQQVKDMASKAKANIKPWAIKLYNMVVSWLLNLIGKSKDLKSKLAKHYKNAQQYISSLDEMKDKAKNSKETIAIKDWGRSVLQVLSLILVISASIKHMNDSLTKLTSDLTQIMSGASNTEDEDAKFKRLLGASSLTLVFNSEVLMMCASVLSMDMFSKEFKSALSNINYDIEKWYGTLVSVGNDDSFKNIDNVDNINISKFFNTKAYANINKDKIDIINKLLNSVAITKATGYKLSVTKDIQKDKVIEMLSKYNSKDISEIRNSAGKILSDDVSAISKPQEANVELGVAYDILKTSLNEFMQIADKNRNLWDFTKYVQPIEKTRRALDSAVKTLDSLSDNESSALLKVIMDTGSFFGMIVKTVDNSINTADTIINSLDKDVISLGRTLKKIK